MTLLNPATQVFKGNGAILVYNTVSIASCAGNFYYIEDTHSDSIEKGKESYSHELSEYPLLR